MHNYFHVFSLMPCFDVDEAALQQDYFAAQRQFHPDRLIGKSASERQNAIHHSMLINEAYETLKSPLKRARHLLALEGMNADASKASPALLMEIMELRETLAEAHDSSVLELIRQQNEHAQEHALSELAKAFTAPDLPGAAEFSMRLSYLIKIGEEIGVMGKRLNAKQQ